MADMATILGDLTTEIREAVCAIDPNTMAGEKNNFKSPKSLEKQDIKDQNGEPRLFEVAWGSPTAIDAGHTEVTWNITGAITIGYPIDTDWNVARASDVQQIFHALNVNLATAGVDYCHVPAGEEPEIEETEDDWIWMSVPLRAALTTT